MKLSEKSKKGYFNLYFMLLLDHISFHYNLSSSSSSFHLRKQNVFILLPFSHNSCRRRVAVILGKIMKPFTQRDNKKFLLNAVDHKIFINDVTLSLFLLSPSLLFATHQNRYCHNAVFNKALNEIRRTKKFCLLSQSCCKIRLPSDHQLI